MFTGLQVTLTFHLPGSLVFCVDISLIILSLVTDMVLHRYQHIQFSTSQQLSNIFMTVAISCLCIMTSYHFDMHVLLFPGILDLGLLLSISSFPYGLLFKIRIEADRFPENNRTCHLHTFMHICIHNRCSEADFLF